VISGVEGIGKHPREQIECEFGDKELDLRIYDFKQKNWRLKITPLHKPIDPSKCELKVKSNSLTIQLKKAESSFWSDIKEKAK